MCAHLADLRGIARTHALWESLDLDIHLPEQFIRLVRILLRLAQGCAALLRSRRLRSRDLCCGRRVQLLQVRSVGLKQLSHDSAQ